MPSEVVTSRLIPASGHEVLTLMDDYGTELLVQVPVNDSASRQSSIDAGVALQTQNVAALEAYAATHSIDLSAAKAAGLLKKQNAKKGIR